MQTDELLLGVLRAGLEVFMRLSMRNVVCFAKESGLSMTQLGALFYIDHSGATGVSQIGDHLGISSAASSQMLDRLVHQGLVSRSEDPHDRRLKQIVLTPMGRQVLHASFVARQSWPNDLAQSLTPSERQQVRAALTILIEKAQHLEPASGPASQLGRLWPREEPFPR